MKAEGLMFSYFFNFSLVRLTVVTKILISSIASVCRGLVSKSMGVDFHPSSFLLHPCISGGEGGIRTHGGR